jgi:hypothetical protein
MQPKNATINNRAGADGLRHLSIEKRHSPRIDATMKPVCRILATAEPATIEIDTARRDHEFRYTMAGESVATFVWAQPDALRYN